MFLIYLLFSTKKHPAVCMRLLKLFKKFVWKSDIEIYNFLDGPGTSKTYNQIPPFSG